MRTETMTQEDIRMRGMDVLEKELGPVGMIRFMQQFGRGKGDYTKERHQWLKRLSGADIASECRLLRRGRKTSG